MASTIDRMREKWESITPRERNLVMLLGTSTVMVLLLWLGLQIRDGLSAIEKRNEATRKALAALLEFRAKGGNKTPSTPSVVIGDEPVKLETYLDETAAETPIGNIPRHNKRNDVTEGDYVITSERFALQGVTLPALTEFLEKVESKNHAVVISELQIKRDFREKEKLNVDMVVSTYSKKKVEGAESGSGAGSAAGTGKGG